MDEILFKLKRDYPEVNFVVGKSFCWSPATRQVMYKNSPSRTQANDISSTFSLLHEVGHALLEHKRYKLDFELLGIEVEAWERARTLALKYDIEIDEDHIQNCLDTYRDWLYRRSICPSCTTKALQLDNKPAYSCFNCHATWQVAPSRFCRPYRKVKGEKVAPVFAASTASKD